MAAAERAGSKKTGRQEAAAHRSCVIEGCFAWVIIAIIIARNDLREV